MSWDFRMLTILLDSPAALAAAIVVLSLLNHTVRALALRMYSRQNFVEQAAHPQGRSGKGRSDRPQLTRSFLFAIVAISLTLSADRVTREIFGGGCLVLLVAGFTQNVGALLTARALVNPTAAEGRIRFSAMCGYHNSGAHMLSSALFSGTVGILFGNLAFIAGSFFLLAAAIGYYWQARRASRRAV